MLVFPIFLSNHPYSMIDVDLLSSALSALRVSGNLVLRHTYAPPWAIEVPSSDALSRLIGAEGEVRTIAFHVVERGELELETVDERVSLGPGELIACFGGLAHRLRRGRGARSIPIEAILSGRASPPTGDDKPQSTRLLCGVFVLRDPSLNPLLAALPPLVQASLDEGELELVGRILHRELREPRNGSAFLIDRTLEMLCAGLLRRYAAEVRDDMVGLFRAMKDPAICHAMEEIHRSPGAPWSVETLARRVGLSRSRFSARFSELVGEAPMTYVTRWRMNVAARMLRASDLSVAEVATAVGYESVPSFSRIFKKTIGLPPALSRAANVISSEV